MNKDEFNIYFNHINWIKLFTSIIICNMTGLSGLFATMPSIFSWYESLVSPWFVPPNYVFAISWSILYILMGFSLYLVWENGLNHPKVKVGIGFFGLQLILNFLWMVFFFGMRSLFLGGGRSSIVACYICYYMVFLWHIKKSCTSVNFLFTLGFFCSSNELLFFSTKLVNRS